MFDCVIPVCSLKTPNGRLSFFILDKQDIFTYNANCCECNRGMV